MVDKDAYCLHCHCCCLSRVLSACLSMNGRTACRDLCDWCIAEGTDEATARDDVQCMYRPTDFVSSRVLICSYLAVHWRY